MDSITQFFAEVSPILILLIIIVVYQHSQIADLQQTIKQHTEHLLWQNKILQYHTELLLDILDDDDSEEDEDFQDPDGPSNGMEISSAGLIRQK